MSKSIRIGIVIGIILLSAIGYFNPGLAIGLLWLGLFSIITLFVISKFETKSKIPHLLFLIALLIHLAAVLFINFTDFRPFGGGADFDLYHYNGKEIANRIEQGEFSFKGLHITHYYSFLIGIIYFLTLPEIIIPQLLTVFLAALSCLLAYFICLEIGGSKKWAFLIGLMVVFYPSYLYFGSVLLKDTLVIPLILIGLLFCLKLIKNFSWRNFLVFYIALGGAIHFRFYVGFALLFTFIFCWLLLGWVKAAPTNPSFSEPVKKRGRYKKFIYSLIIIPLLGFLPQISGYGYYGIKPIIYHFTPSTIVTYREVHYAPELVSPTSPTTPTTPTSPTTPATPKSLAKRIVSKLLPRVKERKSGVDVGTGSSLIIETKADNSLSFLFNSLISFTYVLLGPLPWQMRYYNQLLAFLETIPWYILLFFFVVKGAWKTITRYRLALPLLVFSVLSLVVLSVFITNFGIATRIRIPSFISLLCLIPLAMIKNEPPRPRTRGRGIPFVCLPAGR